MSLAHSHTAPLHPGGDLGDRGRRGAGTGAGGHPAGYTAQGQGSQREILLAVDEFSAVSRRLPIWQLYERARSLGLALQVSAQSWHGLAPRDDDRYRIAAAQPQAG